LCELCIGAHANAPGPRHRIRGGLNNICIALYPCLALTIQNRYLCNQFVRFLGTLDESGNFWRWTTYGDVYAMARSLSSYFQEIREGEGQQFIAISSHNCVEWVVSESAITFARGVCVPIHTTVDRTQLVIMLNHSESTILMCDEAVAQKLGNFEKDCPKLQKLIVFGSPEWKQCVAEEDSDKWKPIIEGERDEMRTLLYTSGSTGSNQIINSFVFLQFPLFLLYRPQGCGAF
jgi:acyl-CoA synthetase (AMP-forming)/AMP-acid ligase II